MVSRLFEGLYIGIATDGIAILRREGWRPCRTSVLASVAAPIADERDARSALTEALRIGNARHAPATVIVSDALSRCFTFSYPGSAAATHEALVTAATAQFPILYRDVPEAWQISCAAVSLHLAVANALPRWLGDTLQAVARRHGIQLLQVTPQFMACWHRWQDALRAGAWFGTVAGEQITLAATIGTAIGDLWSMPFAAALWSDLPGSVTQLRRGAVRRDLPFPSLVQVCGPRMGGRSGDTCNGLDFQWLEPQGPRRDDGVEESDAHYLARCGLDA